MTDRTLKIPDKQIDFIRLVLRSPDKGDGWRSVSDTLRGFAVNTIAEQPELYETKDDGGVLMLRLSSEGAVLGEYL